MNPMLGGTPAHQRMEWRVYPAVPQEIARPMMDSGLTPILSQLLYNRGFHSPDQAMAFLSTDEVFHDAALLPGLEQALERLRTAVRKQERVAVFGDFDVDGITGTAIMALTLTSLGVEVIPYIPHRVDEGHGLSTDAVSHLAAQGATLLVTVDTGVTAFAEVAAAQDMGVDVIITDHHLAPQGAPDAYAIIDPQLPVSMYPFPHLTGAGLAYKLCEALLQSFSSSAQEQLGTLLSLAALGTVADVAPLLDENRSLVRRGLEELARSSSTGLQAMFRTARIEDVTFDAETIGWVLAPRLNAAGRLDHADASYRLLVTNDAGEAEALALQLEQQNRDRRTMTAEAYQKARSLVEPGPLIMVGDESFSPGIIGLVASRLAEEFHRPAVVLSLGPDVSRGSCRSIPEFDIGSALHEVAPKVEGMLRFGGHPQAAGFTIVTSSLDSLQKQLTSVAQEALSDHVLQPRLDIDVELPLRDLPRDIYPTVQRLAPFGAANPFPLFLSRNVQLMSSRQIGSNGDHSLLKLKENGIIWDAIAFRNSCRLPEGIDKVDVVYTIEIDRWKSSQTLRLNVKDVRPAVAA